jgi:hypothetical protein
MSLTTGRRYVELPFSRIPAELVELRAACPVPWRLDNFGGP